MKELTVVGATPNGDAIVLSDGKGAKFLVANDPRLAAAIHHRQLEIALQTFSPREIQARVRAGASAEVVAAETGWPLDKVLRYAEPLLAERAFIAEQAQNVEVRRTPGGTTLRETAAEALGTDPEAEAITWDAWRREDGKWVITAAYADHAGPHSAQWTYDHAGRNIHPLDDDARALMGVRRADADDDIAALTDALDLIADRPVDRASDEPPARPRLVAVPDSDDEPVEVVEEIVTPTHREETVTIPAPDAAAEPPAKKAAPRKAKARRGRASVPSWDEILFGASRPDEDPPT